MACVLRTCRIRSLRGVSLMRRSTFLRVRSVVRWLFWLTVFGALFLLGAELVFFVWNVFGIHGGGW